MIISTGIRTRGFRKWYERELLRSHGHLVLLLLSWVGSLGALESLPAAMAGDRPGLGLCVLAAAAAGAWALRRYLFHLRRAEGVANQAECSACSAFGRWELEADSRDSAGGTRLRVRCRGCGHRWHIDY